MKAMSRITPTQTFRNGITPLPCSAIATAFRKTVSLSLACELAELLSELSKRGVNVSRGLEIPIRKWAAKTAREFNKNTRKGRGLLLSR